MNKLPIAVVAAAILISSAVPVMAQQSTYLRGNNYLMFIGEGMTSSSLTFPYPSGLDHMYWWEWALRYGGSTHYASDFATTVFVPSNTETKFAMWVGDNGDFRVVVMAFSYEPRRVDFLFIITPLRNVGPFTFYQGADFDIDGSSGGDYGYYYSASDVGYGVGNAGTYIGFFSPTARSTSHETNYYSTIWSHISSGSLSGASYFGPGDMGVALGFSMPSSGGQIRIRLGFGASAAELSQALGVQVLPPT
jgi:hypothetical protein